MTFINILGYNFGIHTKPNISSPQIDFLLLCMFYIINKGEFMKKLLKTFVIFALTLCTCFTFVGCKDKDKSKTNEDIYAICKTSVAKMENTNQYTKGFTITENGKSTNTAKINESKFITDGWTEDERANYIKKYNESIYNSTNGGKKVISYNRLTNTGYEIHFDLPDENGQEAVSQYEFFETVNSENGTNYTLYRYNVNDAGEETTVEQSKFILDAEYYRNFFEEYGYAVDDVKEFVKSKSLNELKDLLLDDIGTEVVNPKYDIKISTEEKGGQYTLNVNIVINLGSINLEGNEGEDIVFKTNLGLVFTEDTIVSISFDYSSQGVMIINQELSSESETPKYLKIPCDFEITTAKTLEFSAVYDEESQPKLTDTDKEAFREYSNFQTNVNYYINGYRVTSKMPYFKAECDDVGLDNLANAENIKWYTDKECTKEFDMATYPSYNLHLYAKDVEPAEGYAFLFIFYDEDIDKVDTDDVGSLYIVETNYGTVSGSYQCAYLNGTKLEAGQEIILDHSKINILVYIYSED